MNVTSERREARITTAKNWFHFIALGEVVLIFMEAGGVGWGGRFCAMLCDLPQCCGDWTQKQTGNYGGINAIHANTVWVSCFFSVFFVH